MESKNELFGQRLKELRNKKDMNQEKVASLLGISRARYSHYENNHVEPDLELLRKFSDFFGVSTDYLLGRTDDQESEVKVDVAGQTIKLTAQEYEVFKELKKYPIAFNELQSDPERKVKNIIKMHDTLKEYIKETENENKE